MTEIQLLELPALALHRGNERKRGSNEAVPRIEFKNDAFNLRGRSAAILRLKARCSSELAHLFNLKPFFHHANS